MKIVTAFNDEFKRSMFRLIQSFAECEAQENYANVRLKYSEDKVKQEKLQNEYEKLVKNLERNICIFIEEASEDSGINYQWAQRKIEQ